MMFGEEAEDVEGALRRKCQGEQTEDIWRT